MKNIIIALVVAVFGATSIFADHHEMPKTDAATTETAPAAEAHPAKKIGRAHV